MSTLPVMEHFYTVQGEGAFSGVPAYFIRLGGCDIGCTWCDVKESWPIDAHQHYSIDEICGWVAETNAQLVVVTGGEPFMHDCSALTQQLKNKGLQINVETSGAYPITGKWDWICLSPKRFKKPIESTLQQAHELKVVICHKNDFRWAAKHAELVNSHCQLFLQPEWDKSDEILPLVIEYVKSNPQWRISLQTHKFMAIP